MSSRVRIKNIHIEPYTWKGIASVAASSIAMVAKELGRIADALESRE